MNQMKTGVLPGISNGAEINGVGRSRMLGRRFGVGISKIRGFLGLDVESFFSREKPVTDAAGLEGNKPKVDGMPPSKKEGPVPSSGDGPALRSFVGDIAAGPNHSSDGQPALKSFVRDTTAAATARMIIGGMNAPELEKAIADALGRSLGNPKVLKATEELWDVAATKPGLAAKDPKLIRVVSLVRASRTLVKKQAEGKKSAEKDAESFDALKKRIRDIDGDINWNRHPEILDARHQHIELVSGLANEYRKIGEEMVKRFGNEETCTALEEIGRALTGKPDSVAKAGLKRRIADAVGTLLQNWDTIEPNKYAWAYPDCVDRKGRLLVDGMQHLRDIASGKVEKPYLGSGKFDEIIQEVRDLMCKERLRRICNEFFRGA